MIEPFHTESAAFCLRGQSETNCHLCKFPTCTVFYHFIVYYIATKGGNAWTSQVSDFQQYLIIDLGATKNVTRIAIQGRPHQSEYVSEFTISYGYNGLDYADFKEPGGNTKVKFRKESERLTQRYCRDVELIKKRLFCCSFARVLVWL